MTCVCTGISVEIDGRFYAADVHVSSPDDGVYVLRIVNSPCDAHVHARQATVESDCSCWFDQRYAQISTLVAPRAALRMNDAARVYVETNLAAL